MAKKVKAAGGEVVADVGGMDWTGARCDSCRHRKPGATFGKLIGLMEVPHVRCRRFPVSVEKPADDFCGEYAPELPRLTDGPTESQTGYVPPAMTDEAGQA